ncbi:hypothetical protein [Undibacterium sp.]|uniref:hypothetical protein n=1 Tax=Undibacterium sp. TaxID=1914977 RepID=UPI0025F71F45|nr:hypothetical protein [Undibacterium sp.]
MMSWFIKNNWAQLLPLLLGLFLGCFFTSWFNAGELATAKGDITTLKAEHSGQVAQAASAALQRIVVANQRADSLQVALDDTEQRLTTSKIETQHEIIKNTTGRACLDRRTVRLLNDQATGGQPASLPPPSSGPAADSTSVATDTDVASWANTAITQYNICRARLNALIAWHNPEDASHD